MSIKGLTDNVLPAFPRLGKLRKGAAQENGRLGKEQSFWRFASERTDVSAAFTAAFGAQPVAITIYLPYTTVAENFTTWREEWTAGGMVHRCDGENMTIWRTPTGHYDSTPRPCPNAGQDKPACKPVGRLTVIIPELIQAGYVGYVTMETHSLNDLLSIQASLLAVAEARGHNDMGLRGVPFVLRRVPELISTPGEDGKRVRRQKYLVKLEPLADWVALQLEASRKLAFGNEQRLALPDGRSVNTVTGEIDDITDAADEDDGEPDSEPADDALPAVSTVTPGQQIAQAASNGNGHSNGMAPGTAPTCPQCGGPMWDNRAKNATAQANGKKPGPEWSCKAGKWNPETKQTDGCDGKLWAGQWQPPAQTEKWTLSLTPEAKALWPELANELCAALAHYAKPDGTPNHKAIGDALATRGYREITGENIMAAFNDLYTAVPL